MTTPDFAVIVPMANEERDFHPFVQALTAVLDELGGGKVYIVVDRVSQDRTLELCQALSRTDPRFVTVWAPENRHVVDAYLRGYREAFSKGHAFLIEMDAGLSHDPKALPLFLQALQDGHDCTFGSRFMPGGSMQESGVYRVFLSRSGTLLANLLLGTRLRDMTSGYQGFQAGVVAEFLAYGLRSKAHFYQTELRYLLRRHTSIEVPIHYRAPSPRVSASAIFDAVKVLMHFFLGRLRGTPAVLPGAVTSRVAPRVSEPPKMQQPHG